jgi:putative endonuclease
MMASAKNGTLYVGVTSDLILRASQHRSAFYAGFAAKYDCKLLVWYEMHETMESASLREKQIKGGSRAAKVRLIGMMNPDWRDLFEGLI